MTYVERDGVRIYYRVDGRGDAPTLFLSNSLGTDLHMWEPQVAGFSERFRLVRYDGRGHGRSDAPSGPYALDDLGADALAVLDALGVERAHVCGASLGGMVALWLAAHHPERVHRAVLVSTAGRIGTAERWEARVAAVRAGGMDAVADMVVDQIFFTEGFPRRDPETARRFRDVLVSTRPDGYIGSCLALRDGDLRNLVPSIRAPALLVAGRQDVSTPVPDVEWLHSNLRGSEFVILEDAAHLCNVEQPDQFREVVV